MPRRVTTELKGIPEAKCKTHVVHREHSLLLDREHSVLLDREYRGRKNKEMGLT